MNNKNLKTLLQVVFFLALGAGLIVWRYRAMGQNDRTEMLAAFGDIKWMSIIPVFIVGILANFFRALRWKMLLRPLNIQPKTSNTFFAILIGYLTNSLIPRLGEVAKCSSLAKYEKARVDKLFGSVISERAFDVLSLLLIMLASLLLEGEKTRLLINKYFLPILYDEAGTLKTAPILALALLLITSAGLFFIFKRKQRNSKVEAIIANLWIGVRSIFLLRNPFLFIFWSVLIWAMYLLQVYFAYDALPQTAHLDWTSALAVMAFGSIGMIATPGGFGAYPIIIGTVLVLFGISEGVGVAFGWVSWGFQTIVTLVLGLLAIALLPIFNNKNYNG